MKSLYKLGLIGLSSGNGHPYSWSAIINGYVPEEMEKCEFPAIPKYLAKQKFPKDRIKQAEVTYVWTQSYHLSERISKAANVPHVVSDFREMLGDIDGLLLARDDAENHYQFSIPFLEAGIPIYIDKPLGFKLSDAKKILEKRRYVGQVFSCSALRYAKEFKLNEKDLIEIGCIKFIQAVVPKEWKKYAVHVIEPVLLLAPPKGKIVEVKKNEFKNNVTVFVSYESGLYLSISCLGYLAAPISIRIVGTNGYKDLVFKDSYAAFKSALLSFLEVVKEKQPIISDDFMLEVVELIERGS